jgi:aerobic carbon-monoxide dehydrogenase medium subunit
VIPAAVDFVRPESLEQALAELADPDARALAGGHSLIPMMKLRLARPSRLVDISGLGLGGVELDGSTIRIGAMTTYDELLSATSVPLPAALLECAAAVGDVQVRNAGTVGGSLAHGDPASDLAAGVIATGATVVVRSPDGERELAAEDLFVGPFTTSLGRQDLLVELRVPAEEPGTGSAYVSFEDPASGYPLAGAAARVEQGGSIVVALTGLGGHPLRARGVEAALAGDGELTGALAEIGGTQDDDAVYRCHLAAVAVERAVETARGRT